MSRARLRHVVALAVCVAASHRATARADFFISINSQQGANTKINNTLTYTYNFGITQSGAASGITLNGVVVNMQGANGVNNISPVIATLFGGLGGTGSVLATGTLPASSLSPQFLDFTIALSPTITAPTGGFSIRLTTANVSDYFFKSSRALLTTDTVGTTVGSSLWIGDSNTTGSAGTTLVTTQTTSAAFTLGATNLGWNYRVTTGTTTSGTVSLSNPQLLTFNGTNGVMTQSLAVSALATSGSVTVTGTPSPFLVAGGTQNLTLALGAGVTGPNSGTATLTFQSVPGNSATTGTTAIGTGTVGVTGTGWNWANAAYTGTAFAFGFVHRNAPTLSGSLAIGNQAVASATFQDSLNVSASTGNAFVSTTGFTGLAASASGTTRSNLVVTAATGTAGSLNSTVSLTLDSNANGVAGLSNGTATVAGSPGSVTTTGTVYTGQSTWNTNGSGQWGTLSSNFGTNWNWAAFDGSPGLDSSFADTDTATFAGAVTSGTATVTIASSTPSVRSLTFNNAAASYLISGSSGGSLALRNSGTTPATVTVSSGTHTLATAIALDSRATIDVAGASLLTASGAMSGTNGIRKSGAGELAITSVNSFTGPTNVDAGVLRVNGSLASSSLTTIESAATLTGSGTLGNTLVLGTHQPGNSPGIETFTDGLTYGSTAVLQWELSANTDATGDRGVTYDGVNVTGGNLQIDAGAEIDLIFTSALSGGSQSTVSWADSFWASNHQWTAISFSGTGSSTGAFTLGSVGNDSLGNPLNSVRPEAYFATQRSGNDIIVVYYAPEPGALAIAGLGLGLIGWRVRRRFVKPPRTGHGDEHAAC